MTMRPKQGPPAAVTPLAPSPFLLSLLFFHLLLLLFLSKTDDGRFSIVDIDGHRRGPGLFGPVRSRGPIKTEKKSKLLKVTPRPWDLLEALDRKARPPRHHRHHRPASVHWNSPSFSFSFFPPLAEFFSSGITELTDTRGEQHSIASKRMAGFWQAEKDPKAGRWILISLREEEKEFFGAIPSGRATTPLFF